MTMTIDPIDKLKRDQREAAKSLSVVEVRYLVDLYYQIQDFRKAAGNQIFALEKASEPVHVIGWAHLSMETIELEIRKWMDIYTDNEPTGMGAWTKAIVGIGPIISAGLLAHIDMNPWRCANTKTQKACLPSAPCGASCQRRRTATAGQIWAFGGLDPTAVWEKGERRPWNANFKVLLWKIGQSFMKFHNNPKDVYGKVYAARKALEIQRNDAGQFADQAATILEKKKFGKTTEAYKAYTKGRLPAGQIDARARRYAVKQFLSDWHGEAYRRTFGEEPPLPYPIAILGHAHVNKRKERS